MSLSIIIPCFNESKNIHATLLKLTEYLTIKKIQAEIIIVDDGSTDNTKKIVEAWDAYNKKIHLYSYPRNQGKGYAVKRGVEYSLEFFPKNDVLFMDADLSTPLNTIERVNFNARNRVTYADRNHPDSYQPKSQRLLRRLAGKIYPVMVNQVLSLNVKDAQCGFKYFSKDTLKVFNYQTIKGFAFDTELLFIAKLYNIELKPLRVEWTNNPNSKVKLIKDSVKMFLSLYKIRRNYLRKGYGKLTDVTKKYLKEQLDDK